MTEHNHLDRQRRQPGECPACDEDWERQRQRLAAASGWVAAERSIDKLVEREGKMGAERYGHRPGRDA